MPTTTGILSEHIDDITRAVVEKLIEQPSDTALSNAKLAIREARTYLAGVVAAHAPSVVTAGPQAEASALTQAVLHEAEDLQKAFGYTREQAFAVKISELTRFQVVAEIAGDSTMLENIRRVKASIIQLLAVPARVHYAS